MQHKISATIIVFNEAKNLKACLKTLENIVDEIILVDSFSTDETVAIAQQFNCFIFKNKFINYKDQKNFADGKANYKWILNIDADERLSYELQKSILQLKTKNNINAGAFKMNRLNYIGETAIKCCGWYPDKKIRLYQKHKTKWAGGPIHEYPKVEKGTQIETLKGDLIHYSYKSKTDFTDRQKKYAKAIAKYRFYEGKKTNLFKIYAKPLVHFFKLYFLKAGFLNRKFGFFLAKGLARERFLREQYLWQLQKGK